MRIALSVFLLLSGVGLIVAGWLRLPEPVTFEPTDGDRSWSLHPVAYSAQFPEKHAARPGEWLWSFDESGQTVEDHLDTCTNRRTPVRNTIILQPFGEIQDHYPALLEDVRSYIAIYYQCEVEIAGALEIPDSTWVEERGQYNADRFLVDLRNRLEGRTLALVGWLDQDLYSDPLNFVFGLGAFHHRVGVYSVYRFDTGNPGDYDVLLQRTCKVATHELGHILGMKHCIRFECNMNGSNSVTETDSEPMHFCPECIRKAISATALEPRRRYRELAGWYDEHGFSQEAAFVRQLAGEE